MPASRGSAASPAILFAFLRKSGRTFGPGVFTIQLQTDRSFLASDFVEVRLSIVSGGAKPAWASIRRWTFEVVAIDHTSRICAAISKSRLFTTAPYSGERPTDERRDDFHCTNSLALNTSNISKMCSHFPSCGALND